MCVYYIYTTTHFFISFQKSTDSRPNIFVEAMHNLHLLVYTHFPAYFNFTQKLCMMHEVRQQQQRRADEMVMTLLIRLINS